MRLHLIGSVASLGGLLISSVAHTALPLCFGEFAFLSNAETAPIPLTVETYEKLLDSLGGSFTPENLTALAEASDPFELPESLRSDHTVLAANLKRFREMLKGRDWINEPLLNHLRSNLQKRAETVRAQARARQEAVRTSVEAVFPRATEIDNTSVLLSPTGRYVINSATRVGDHHRQFKGYVIDLEKHTRVEVQSPQITDTKYAGLIAFAEDGSAAYFMLVNHQVLSVPFVDGNLNWDRGTRLGGGAPVGASTPSFYGTMRNLYSIIGGAKFERRDLKTDQHQEIALPESKAEAWQLQRVSDIPHSNRIEVLKTSPTLGTRLETYELDPGGKLIHPEIRFTVPGEHKHLSVFWLSNGNPIAFHDLKLEEWLPGEKRVERFNYRKSPSTRGGYIITGYPQLGDQIGLLKEGNKGATWVELVELNTGKLSEVDLPDRTGQLTFLPDGSSALIVTGKEIRRVDFRTRMRTVP